MGPSCRCEMTSPWVYINTFRTSHLQLSIAYLSSGPELIRSIHVTLISTPSMGCIPNTVRDGRLKSLSLFDLIPAYISYAAHGDVSYDRVSCPSRACPRQSIIGQPAAHRKVVVHIPGRLLPRRRLRRVPKWKGLFR